MNVCVLVRCMGSISGLSVCVCGALMLCSVYRFYLCHEHVVKAEVGSDFGLER